MHSRQLLYLTSKMPQVHRIILVFLTLLLYKTGWGQGGLPLILLKDRYGGTPIEKAHMRDLASGRVWISDPEGSISVEGTAFPVELEITHIAYQQRRIGITGDDFEMDGTLVIELEPRIVLLDPVQISPPGPQIVHQPADLHVGAYHVNHDGVWVLVYAKKQIWHREADAGDQVFRGASLHLLDLGLRQIASLNFPAEVKDLVHDHQQRPIIVTPHDAYIVGRIGDRIDLQRIDLATLNGSVLPWKASIGGELIGSDQQSTYLAFNFIAFDMVSQESRVICTVEEKHTLELFRSQYKYMSGREKVIAMDLELETGIDREIIAGYMTGFHNDIYYHEPYAPVFVVNDTICIFDLSIDRIRRFDRAYTAIDEIPIHFHEQRSWRAMLIQDPVTERIYSIHQRNERIWLNEIDPRTGNAVESPPLHHPYAGEVKVHDGRVWYVYRPFGSLQRRTLYREPLRISAAPGS